MRVALGDRQHEPRVPVGQRELAVGAAAELCSYSHGLYSYGLCSLWPI